MSVLYIQLDTIRRLRERLYPGMVRLTNASNGFDFTRSGVDSQIAARRSIGSRMSRASQAIYSLDDRLRALDAFILLAMDRYSQAESELNGKASEMETIFKNWQLFLNEYGVVKDSRLYSLFFDLMNPAISSLDSRQLLRYADDLNLRLFTDEFGNVRIRIIDGRNGLLSVEDYRNLLIQTFGGPSTWGRNFVSQLANDGAILYGPQGLNTNDAARFRGNIMSDLAGYIDDLKYNKNEKFWNTLGRTFVNEAKVWDDYRGWNSAMTGTGKFMGAAGNILMVGNDFYDNFYDPATGKFNYSGEKLEEFAADVGVDVATGAAFMATGAAVGSFFLPPLGTAIGFGTGALLNYGFNYKFGPGNKSLVDYTKDEVKYTLDHPVQAAKNVVNFFNDTNDFIEKKELEAAQYLSDLTWKVEQQAADFVKDVANSTVNAVSDGINNVANQVKDGVQDAAKKIVNGIGKQVSNIFW